MFYCGTIVYVFNICEQMYVKNNTNTQPTCNKSRILNRTTEKGVQIKPWIDLI